MADLTLRGRIRVEKVDTRSEALHVVCEVLATSLPSWRIKDGELLLGTDDFFIEKGEGEEAAHEVGKWVEIIFTVGLANALCKNRKVAVHLHIQNLQKAGIWSYGTRTPQNETKVPMSSGLIRAANMAFGAYAAMNCPIPV